MLRKLKDKVIVMTKYIITALFALTLAFSAACTNMNRTQQGALSGAAIGAGAGLGLTAITGGSLGAGALVGGALGGIAGGLYGQEQDRRAHSYGY